MFISKRFLPFVSQSLALGVISTLGASVAFAQTRQPTHDEYGLLVYANRARAAINVPPLQWNDDLFRAALSHSAKMAETGIFSHNTAGDGKMETRVPKFYTKAVAVGENIGNLSGEAYGAHYAWMVSAPHRAAIESSNFSEFGAAFVVGQTGFGPVPYSTEDFGSRGLIGLEDIPSLPSGTVLPVESNGFINHDFLVNYYHFNGQAPQKVTAGVGTSCINLAKADSALAPNHALYKTTRALTGNGCVPVFFEAVRSDQKFARYPKSGAILVAVGSGQCATRTTVTPQFSCVGATPPTDTPGNTDQWTFVPTNSDPAHTNTVAKLRLLLTFKKNGAPVKGAKVKGLITGPKGYRSNITGLTNASGQVKIQRSYSRGTRAGDYVVEIQSVANSDKGIPSISASAGFTVRAK